MGAGGFQVVPGDPCILGASRRDDGCNFALFSAHAERVELCLYDPSGERETARLDLIRTGEDVWHGFVPGVQEGDCYGYRVHGPFDPRAGHRFNPHKLLLDPYARHTRGAFTWREEHFAYLSESADQDLGFDTRDNARWVPKGVVTSFDEPLVDARPWATAWDRTLIYEAHVRGLTMRHPDVPEHLRGSFDGLAQAELIDYLKALGVTALELMPVQGFIDEHFLHRGGLSNYWGYNSLTFFAPHSGYLAGAGPLAFRRMVDRFHDAGIEVILDVVYNHTAEGDQLGPTLSFRGIDNASYYRLQHQDKRFYANDSGCGNTLDISHPRVLQLVMDSLRYWAGTMGVDGFRFDLATVLGRDASGFDRQRSFFHTLAQDPLLARVKLIAEPWDIGPGGYQLGGFPRGWSEWNDRYRDTVRQFWRGDPGLMPEFARRLHGSSDVFEPGGRSPSASVQFVASHDGFTLRDLVSYEARHNEANGEANLDGHKSNFSANHGCEGETNDPAILALRLRQQKNFLATLFVSQGVPMLLAGDELGHSQGGNNNAYCQDNRTTWIDWEVLRRENGELLNFTRELVRLRQQHPVLRFPEYVHVSTEPGEPGIHWLNADGEEMREEHWHEHQNQLLGYMLIGPADGIAGGIDKLLVIFNKGPHSGEFFLPAHGEQRHWQLLLDTATSIESNEHAQAMRHGRIALAGRSLHVYQALAACEYPKETNYE